MSEKEILAGAARRIDKYRKAEALVRVATRAGKPVKNARLRIEQTRHAFLFGCNAFPLLRFEDPKQEAAFEKEFTALLNYATLGFYWGRYEPLPGKTQPAQLEAQARWLKKRGVIIKGHPLVWQEVYPDWAPSKPDAVRKAFAKRVTDIVSRFAGLIDRWDVVNEATDAAQHDNGVANWAKRDGSLALTSESLGWAHAANPKALLLYNDYNVGADFEALCRGLIDTHQPVDAIGIQSHMHAREWTMTKVWRVCETYARFGKPLHFTEATAVSGKHGWKLPAPWKTTPAGEARQADYVEKFYTVLFSHPAVQAITWWDFADGGFMGAPGGLVRRDLTPKPAYERLMNLIKGKWWTQKELVTDVKGEAKFRGFLGRYRITAETPQGRQAKSLELKPGGAQIITVIIN